MRKPDQTAVEDLFRDLFGRRIGSHKYPSKSFRLPIVRLDVGRDKSLRSADDQLLVCSYMLISWTKKGNREIISTFRTRQNR